MLGRWTCHPSIGLVILELGLRPSFILNIKLGMFLDLHIGTLDLSPQHWTCHLKLGLVIMIVSELACLDTGLVTPALDFSF